MESNEHNLLRGETRETNLLSPLRDVSPSNSLHSDYSDDSGIVPSVEMVKSSDESTADDLDEKNVSDWGSNARRSWICSGHTRVFINENDSPDFYETEAEEEEQSFLEIGDQIYKDPPRRGESYRRFSTACAPFRTLSENIPIPEVVITSHDDDDIDDETGSQVSPKRRMLRRSMSSPDGVLSQLSQETCLKLANLAMDLQEGADYVTLEDVEKFKLRKRKSVASSITSLNDDRWDLDK